MGASWNLEHSSNALSDCSSWTLGVFLLPGTVWAAAAAGAAAVDVARMQRHVLLLLQSVTTKHWPVGEAKATRVPAL